MKFNHPPKPKLGDTRIKSRFLLFPKTIDNTTRWLERASWKELYDDNIYNEFFSPFWSAIEWTDL